MPSNTQPQAAHASELRVVGQPQRTLAIGSGPYSQEAEEAVLGAVLINPDSFWDVIGNLSPDDFYLLRHRYIWQAIVNLVERGEPLDYLTLIHELRNTGKLDDIGGPAYITQLVNSVPSSLHSEIYAQLVERTATRRKLLETADQIKALALDESLSLETVVEGVEKSIMVATESRKTAGVTSVETAIAVNMNKVADARDNPQQLAGIPTGIQSLDDMIGGLRKRRLYYVGGRTHMGKTSCLLSIALNAGLAGARVQYVTREETEGDLTSRMLGIEACLNKDDIETGNLSDDEYQLYIEVCNRVAKRHIFLDANTTSITPRGLYSMVKAQQHKTGIDLLIFDYLGLMSAGPLDSKGLYEKISYLCDSLQKITHKLDIPVMVGIQLHRDVRKRPTLTDFEGSGRIEQTADVAMLLYRESYYKSEVDEPDKAEIIVAKNKVTNKTGTVFAYSNPVSSRWSDWQ